MLAPVTITGLLLSLMLRVGSEYSISQTQRRWTETFPEDSSSFSAQGVNPFFVLEPGYQLHLKGSEHSKSVELVITVLDETRVVDAVETRIV